MTMTWGVNPTNNDIVIKGGTIFITYGSAEVRQRILITLQHLWQEYFLNVPAGVPWNELILGSKKYDDIAALLRQIVLAVPGVISIVSFSMLNAGKRNWKIEMRVEVSGETGGDILTLLFPLSGYIDQLPILDVNAVTDSGLRLG